MTLKTPSFTKNIGRHPAVCSLLFHAWLAQRNHISFPCSCDPPPPIRQEKVMFHALPQIIHHDTFPCIFLGIERRSTHKTIHILKAYKISHNLVKQETWRVAIDIVVWNLFEMVAKTSKLLNSFELKKCCLNFPSSLQLLKRINLLTSTDIWIKKVGYDVNVN